MELKVQELAKSGLFKTDPVAAMKQMGEHAASVGDFDAYQKYTTTADATQKAASDKSGMLAVAASMTSPNDTAKYLNEWSKAAGMAGNYQPVTNPDGTFTMLGMGTDPKVGKKYTSLQELNHDTMMLLAPSLLGPEKGLGFGTDVAYKEAQTHGAEATAGHQEALTTSEEIGQKWIDPKAKADIAQSGAAVRASDASANLSGVQANRIGELLPYEVAGKAEDVTAQQEANRLASDIHGSKVSEAVTTANAARRAEFEAVDTAPARKAAIEADAVAKLATAAEGTVKAQYAGPEAEASLAGKAAQADQATAYAEALRTNKKQGDLGKAVKAYVVGPPMGIDNPDFVPPLEGNEAVLNEIGSAIMDETGATATSAAGTTHEILQTIKGVVGVDLRNGVVHMYDGSTRNVGVTAAQRIDRLRQQYSKKAQAAASAGIGVGK
jgi:hypothetical protein